MGTNQDEQVGKVLEIIKDVRIAMLTSRTAQGVLESRPMSTQDTEYDGSLYFIAEADSDLAKQIQTDPQVNLAYAKKGSWLSVHGTARIVHDPARLKELWSVGADAFTDGGPENPENVLLTVQLEGAQYWDSPSAPVMLVSMLKASATGGKPGAGESESVDL